jgi:hypothetical protein
MTFSNIMSIVFISQAHTIANIIILAPHPCIGIRVEGNHKEPYHIGTTLVLPRQVDISWFSYPSDLSVPETLSGDYDVALIHCLQTS